MHLTKLYLRQIFAIADWVSTPSQPAAKYHIVQPRETLYRISIIYNVTVDQLRKLNGIPENSAIWSGQKLRIS